MGERLTGAVQVPVIGSVRSSEDYELAEESVALGL